MRNKIKLTVFIMALSLAVCAQKKDTSAAMNMFTKSLAVLSEVPLNMQMTIANSSDVVFTENDLFSMNAVVCVQKSSSYMRFGEIEQFATDSVVLMISDSLEQIILFPADKSLADRLSFLPGMKTGDLPPEKLSKEYSSELFQDGVRLNSRRLLPGTELPREYIQLIVDRNGLLPVQLQILRRTLVPVDSAQAEGIRNELPQSSSRFLRRLSGFYFIKETQTKFIYRQIDHLEKDLPVQLYSRVRKTESGEWAPAADYENYRLVNQTND